MYLASTIGTIHEGKTREYVDSKFIISTEVKKLLQLCYMRVKWLFTLGWNNYASLRKKVC